MFTPLTKPISRYNPVARLLNAGDVIMTKFNDSAARVEGAFQVRPALVIQAPNIEDEARGVLVAFGSSNIGEVTDDEVMISSSLDFAGLYGPVKFSMSRVALIPYSDEFIVIRPDGQARIGSIHPSQVNQVRLAYEASQSSLNPAPCACP